MRSIARSDTDLAASRIAFAIPSGPELPCATTATPRPAHAPAARIAPIKATVKAKALKAFSGTAADADADVLMVRVGLVRVSRRRCETLQKSGRLSRTRATAGKCIPTTWLEAAGTTSWKLKLRRRLAPGRYQLYAQAVDAGGRAQVTFTRAAGNLRSFRVR